MTTLNLAFRRAALPTILSSLMLSLGVLGAAIAQADQASSFSSTQQVTLADLNLSTADGQRLAQERVNEVAKTLCARVADELDLSHHANYLKCVDSTVTTAGLRLQALVAQQTATRVARADVK